MSPSLGLREVSVFMVEDCEVECRILRVLAAGVLDQIGMFDRSAVPGKPGRC